MVRFRHIHPSFCNQNAGLLLVCHSADCLLSRSPLCSPHQRRSSPAVTFQASRQEAPFKAACSRTWGLDLQQSMQPLQRKRTASAIGEQTKVLWELLCRFNQALCSIYLLAIESRSRVFRQKAVRTNQRLHILQARPVLPMRRLPSCQQT